MPLSSHASVSCPSCSVAGHSSVVSSVIGLLLTHRVMGLIYSFMGSFLKCQVQSYGCCHCGHLLLIMKLAAKCTLEVPTLCNFPKWRLLLVQMSGRAPWGAGLPQALELKGMETQDLELSAPSVIPVTYVL